MDANEFYRRAQVVSATGNYEYAIDQYLRGLNLEPENVAAHQELREIALERAAKGGKPLGLFEKLKVSSVLRQASGDNKAKMLAAENLLSYEPGQVSYMLDLLKHARAGDFHDTAAWIGTIIRRHQSGA
jgi:hypothetical protein